MASGSSEDGTEYRVIRRLAVGGMAEIFEAVDERDERVVLKVPLPQYSDDARFAEHLEHEGELNARLDHKNLVRVKGLVTHRGSRCIVMELVDGISLAELRQRQAKLPVPVVLHLARELLSALVYVHEAVDENGVSLAIVHRDVTPENVLLTREGEVKLGDFGIARSSLRDARTRTGVIKGKLQYLAPEQVTGSTIDARTDLYALSVILFELLTGERWLEGETEIEVLKRAEDPPARRLASFVEIDRELAAFVERNLARFAEERHPSARAALSALDRIGERLSIAPPAELGALVAKLARPPAIERVTPEPAAAKRRSSMFVWIALGLGTAAIAVVIGMSSRPPEGPDRAERPIAPAIAPPIETARDAGGPIDAGRDESAPDAGAPDAGPTKTRRIVDPTMEVEPGPDPSVARRAAIERSLAEVAPPSGLGWADLPSELRAERESIASAIRAGELDAAERRIDALSARVSTTAIDHPLVQRKLDRVNALIRSARAAGREVPSEVDDLAASALRSFVDGRDAETNATLNRILALLRP
jgi:eukaryotic-like serine/threonine-protein kinase